MALTVGSQGNNGERERERLGEAEIYIWTKTDSQKTEREKYLNRYKNLCISDDVAMKKSPRGCKEI